MQSHGKNGNSKIQGTATKSDSLRICKFCMTRMWQRCSSTVTQHSRPYLQNHRQICPRYLQRCCHHQIRRENPRKFHHSKQLHKTNTSNSQFMHLCHAKQDQKYNRNTSQCIDTLKCSGIRRLHSKLFSAIQV